MSSREQPPEASVRSYSLSDPEISCLALVAEGRRLTDIGSMLAMPEGEVERILLTIEKKLGANNRLHAVSIALIEGIIADGDIIQ